jgi:FKBP-type peptidyl-prolyl cis-trans isomerase
MMRFLIVGCMTFIYALACGQNTGYQKTSSGLEYQILKPGNGEKPHAGNRIWVEYTGKLTNDSVFATTKETGNADFFMGQGQIIKGWEEGLSMIGEGGEINCGFLRNLDMVNENSGIPANSTLLFEIKLLQVDRALPLNHFRPKELKS